MFIEESDCHTSMRTKFRSQDPHKKPGPAACLCNLRVGEAKTGGSSKLIGQPAW